MRDVAEAIARAPEHPDHVGESYIIGKGGVTIGEVNRAVAGWTGTRLPRLSMHDALAAVAARRPDPWWRRTSLGGGKHVRLGSCRSEIPEPE